MKIGDNFLKTVTSFLFLILLPLLSFTVIGCSNNEDIKKVDLTKTEEVKDTPGEPLGIKIGLVPVEDIRKMAARYEPLAKYLSNKMGLRVTFIYLDNYSEVCDRFIYNKLDAAFFGSFSYVLTHAKASVEPVARPDCHGVSTYKGLIIVRKDSSINNIADMKGKRLALVHQATYAGYLYPLYYFKECGVMDLKKYFSKVIFTGRHDKAIFAVLSGEADIAASKDSVYERSVKENPQLEKELVILSASGPVPSNTLCVSKNLNPELKNKLRNILLNSENDDEAKPALEALEATKFVETRDQDYRYLYDMIKTLGIVLDTYPYYESP